MDEIINRATTRTAERRIRGVGTACAVTACAVALFVTSAQAQKPAAPPPRDVANAQMKIIAPTEPLASEA
jgi:hypothetical protein